MCGHSDRKTVHEEGCPCPLDDKLAESQMSWEGSPIQEVHMDHMGLQLLLLSPSQYTVLVIRGRSSVQWAFGFSSSFWNYLNYLILPRLLPHSVYSGWEGSAGFPQLGWDLVTFKNDLNASKGYEFGLVTSPRISSFSCYR